MKNITLTQITVIGIVTTFLIFLGISQYGQKKHAKEDAYLTHSTTPSSVMIFGGMAADKKKIDSFKKDFERDDNFNKFWNYLDLSSEYAKKEDYINAIVQREKALELAIKEMGEGAQWQARAGLAELYAKAGRYNDAIEQYDWIIAYQEGILKDFIAKKSKFEIIQKEKLLQGLKSARAKIEELKLKTELEKK